MHHLETLRLRLSHELDRYAHAKTADERRLRKVWIEQVEQEIRSALDLWNDKDSSRKELQLALAFWSRYHSPGSRNRVRAAVAYYRKWNKQPKRHIAAVTRSLKIDTAARVG